MVGFNLSTDLTPLQEQQLQTIWHGIVGLVLIIIIIAHIYIGSLGMQGAFDAMNSVKWIEIGQKNIMVYGLKKKIKKLKILVKTVLNNPLNNQKRILKSEGSF